MTKKGNECLGLKFRAEKGQKFSKYTIIEENGIDDMDDASARDAERLIGEGLRQLSFMGWIKAVGTAKSHSGKRPAKGRPAIVYEVIEPVVNFSLTKGYKCLKCNTLIPLEKDMLRFCPNCGNKMEE